MAMQRLAGFGSFRHLASRFAGSLWPGGPNPTGEAWARRWLLPGERDIWARLAGPDRRHAVGVSRRVAASLGNADGAGIPRQVLAAALLHDSGKVESGFGTFGRVFVTLVAAAAGRSQVAAWGDRDTGWRRRAGRYVRHDILGAQLLEAAGSHAVTSTWAREHHLPPSSWTVEPEWAHALKAADDD
jgi:hypothetical protein